MQRIIKPKTKRTKRALEQRESKIFENEKTAMFIKGGVCPQTVTQLLKELYLLRKPLSIMYQRKNLQRPFEDATSLEFFSQKSDASLFLFGCHSKKRPNNLIMGRMYDYHVLDMVEFGIENFVSMSNFPGGKVALGMKPCLIFTGKEFEDDVDLVRIRNLLTDFFRGPKLEKLRVGGVEHIWSFTVVAGKIYVRSYRAKLVKSSYRIPSPELEEIGPSFDLVVRRKHLASLDLYKKACKQPKESKIQEKKNVSRDAFGTKLGRIHMTRQNIEKKPVRRVKALKKSTSENTQKDSVKQPSVVKEVEDSNSQEPPRKKRKI